eukprot:7383974-Prymnesium_polylepis.5
MHSLTCLTRLPVSRRDGRPVLYPGLLCCGDLQLQLVGHHGKARVAGKFRKRLEVYLYLPYTGLARQLNFPRGLSSHALATPERALAAIHRTVRRVVVNDTRRAGADHVRAVCNAWTALQIHRPHFCCHLLQLIAQPGHDQLSEQRREALLVHFTLQQYNMWNGLNVASLTHCLKLVCQLCENGRKRLQQLRGHGPSHCAEVQPVTLSQRKVELRAQRAHHEVHLVEDQCALLPLPPHAQDCAHLLLRASERLPCVERGGSGLAGLVASVRVPCLDGSPAAPQQAAECSQTHVRYLHATALHRDRQAIKLELGHSSRPNAAKRAAQHITSLLNEWCRHAHCHAALPVCQSKRQQGGHHRGLALAHQHLSHPRATLDANTRQLTDQLHLPWSQEKAGQILKDDQIRIYAHPKLPSGKSRNSLYPAALSAQHSCGHLAKLLRFGGDVLQRAAIECLAAATATQCACNRAQQCR